MEAITILAKALGIAYASGISLYATVALLGLVERMGWVTSLPASLEPVGSTWVIALAGALAAVEFLANLVPGVASVWETVHSVIRPPAAAVLAILVAWNGDPGLIVAAGLLGGGLGLTTHATKLGLRYTIDTSPEPVSNGAANLAELGVVAALVYFIWQYPFLALTAALVLLVLLILAVRSIWRAVRRAFSTRPRLRGPAPG